MRKHIYRKDPLLPKIYSFLIHDIFEKYICTRKLIYERKDIKNGTYAKNVKNFVFKLNDKFEFKSGLG